MDELKYPVGMQSFPEIREKNFVYVDKTQYIPMLMKRGKYFFLGRPRRFGKSLFLSMLHAYFEGREELFEGLAISRHEHDWKNFPILHLDFTGRNYTKEGSLDSALDSVLSKYETVYNCHLEGKEPDERFENIISNVYRQTGRKVVILIDEYDKPLLDTIELPELQDMFRNELRGIYGNLKKMDSYIEFAFLTGITRFGKLNIFSDLNNLKDLSMVEDFCGICGITSEELHKYFDSGIEALAKWNNITVEDSYEQLRLNYDGYHFSPKGCPDIYNPFSLLNALQDRAIGQYWFSTGTPRFLARQIKSQAIELEDLNETEVTQRQLENVPFDMEGDTIPILYQSGYLTIKSYNQKNGIITLGYPNREVELGFHEQLMNAYTPGTSTKSAFGLLKFKKDVETGNIEGFMRRLQCLFASISYDSFNLMNLEQHYQNIIYLLFKLLGYYCHAEYRTSTGRIDLMIETDKHIYLFEFKLNRTAQEALDQINCKEYLLPFKFDNRQAYKIGANFCSEKKNLDSWIIEPAS